MNKSYLSVATGIGINFGKNTITLSAEWFAKVHEHSSTDQNASTEMVWERFNALIGFSLPFYTSGK